MTTDKKLVRERFEANFRRYDRLAHVQQRICGKLSAHAGDLCPGPVLRALEIGIGTGFLTKHLLRIYPDAVWFLNDIAPAAEGFVSKYAGGAAVQYIWGDAESVDFPGELDLIASASTVQWFDDMPGFIAKAAAVTKSGGKLMLSTFGKQNFREIKETAGEGLEYYTLPELEKMVEAAGYKILHSEEYTQSLRFDTPTDVLRHIKATGVNSLSKAHWNRGRLARFEEQYRKDFSAEDGGVTLTYHPIILVAGRL